MELYAVFSTLSGGPYEALLPEIARTSADRVSLVGVRVFFGVAGAAVGLVDASLGWAISSLVGPGGPEAGPTSPAAWVGTALFVMALAALVAALGGVAARFRAGSSPEQAG